MVWGLMKSDVRTPDGIGCKGTPVKLDAKAPGGSAWGPR